MSKITQKDIHHIATLAKIHVDEEESTYLCEKLSNILDLVEQMQSVDTENIEPLSHAIFQNLKLREDQPIEVNERDYYQQLSQETHNGFYLVPKVIE